MHRILGSAIMEEQSEAVSREVLLHDRCLTQIHVRSSSTCTASEKKIAESPQMELHLVAPEPRTTLYW
jgi:hypothetical protein